MLLSADTGLTNIGIACLWFNCFIPGAVWELRVTFEFVSVSALDMKNNLKFPSIIIIIIYRELWAVWGMNDSNMPGSFLNYKCHNDWKDGCLGKTGTAFTLAGLTRLITLKRLFYFYFFNMFWAVQNLEISQPGFPQYNSCSLGE